MAFIITISNDAGTLDTRYAETGAAALAQAIEMLRECGELRDGDTLRIREAD